MKTVCIIGGGFSGSLTAIQLLAISNNVQVKLLNDGHPLIRGIAYSTAADEHLLNVPAGRMSAFPDQPAHFTAWLRSKPEYRSYITETLDTEFIPRMMYGAYLQELMNAHSTNERLEIIAAKAISVDEKNEGYQITLNTGQTISANALVLAMGNFLPAAPKIVNRAVFEHVRYFKSPWNNAYLKDLSDDETVLLIGTGLTMVDCVLSLKKIKFKGKIIAVSPRGYIPASHAKAAVYSDFYTEIKDEPLLEIFKAVRKHLKTAANAGLPWQLVIDSIRPYAQAIWTGLSKKEKQQFTSHLRHIWGVARHRLPENIFNTIMDAVKSGQLQVIGGRIAAMDEAGTSFRVSIKPRKEQSLQPLGVSRIVNCTGPQINYAELNDPFVKSLLSNSLIYPDALKMGIAAAQNGQVLNGEGNPVKNVYALGSLLRGVLWETTAVPEIRRQAENVARQISESMN